MSTLVLLSGGLDSAVLAAHEAQHDRVRPVYVSVGLAWEAAELAMLDRLLAAPVFANARSARARRVHDARRLSAVALGDSRRAARLRHAG